MTHEPALLRSTEGTPMALEGVDARGRVRGLLFELTVEQRYRNASSRNVECVYTFPLPFEAVLLDLDVEIAGRRLAAAVVEKREAERRYEKAMDDGDSAVMLERAGDGLCTLNLGNLMAGERAVIRYRYAQLQRFEQGSVRVAIPTVIAPRYGDPDAAGLAPHQVPATDLRAHYPLGLVLDVEGALAAGRLASPSHAIDVVRTEAGVRVTLAGEACLDRDFVLNVDGLAGRSVATLGRDGDGVVALASFCAEVPKEAGDLPLALKLLVDCSGSMAGDSIDAARRALHRILMGLRPADLFSLSRFGSMVRHEMSGLVKAGDREVRAAAEALGRMDADLGGTEMESALRAVFALGAGGAASDVLAITDGEVWDAKGLVHAARAARQRVFVVGIGSAPAEGVLKRLAEASGGACEFVAPNEDVEGAILRMFARMRAPRVERAEVAWPAPPAWTAPLPGSLFGGETVHAFAGFAPAIGGEATLSLLPAGGGAPLQSTARFAGAVDTDDTLARVAAARRCEVADAATQLDLALRYRLLTDRTNLLVVAERAAGEKANELPQIARIAQMHAAGWHGLGSVASDAFMRLRTVHAAPDAGVRFCASVAFPDCEQSPTVSDMADAVSPCMGEPALAGGHGIDALLADGLPFAWRHVLVALVDEGFDEHEVCAAFLAVLAARLLREGPRGTRHVDRQLRHWAGARVEETLRKRLRSIVDGTGAPEPVATAAWLRDRATPVTQF